MGLELRLALGLGLGLGSPAAVAASGSRMAASASRWLRPSRSMAGRTAARGAACRAGSTLPPGAKASAAAAQIAEAAIRKEAFAMGGEV